MTEKREYTFHNKVDDIPNYPNYPNLFIRGGAFVV